jgi:hypothetical protein
MRNVSDKSCRENKNTFSLTFIPKNLAVYEIMWKNADGNVIRLMSFACWINKATGSHSEYLILIAVPRQH